ncbi:tetratricopeptide repeat protein [Turneriella parva]|uniref:Tetratricopeptide TPR_2 repeat-containing protein n=1 Tax=Turneriella parva (strain ATCC BAA-1111 / DSM 21527 / NCTC 11395 / H) TaxID=869212 RepID=I4B9F5_TURPD|nr:tetratricopeptide repeat protein [Turneriella parva]AFM13912.1 Tetratricopeptide TPR_2 repeat-containing protein [Turneriella parva DSM 21527]
MRARYLTLLLFYLVCLPENTAAKVTVTGSAVSHFEHGLAAHNRADLKAAEFHYARALQLDGTLVSAAINLAIVYEAWHKDELALKFYNEAVRVSPRSFAARYNRGQYLQKQGELAAAREDYRVALEVKPDEASLYINLAAIELKLFETELDVRLITAAEKNLRQAERLKSKSPALYFNRARLFELHNFPARARTAYREAMRYYPETSVEYQTCLNRAERLSRQLK